MRGHVRWCSMAMTNEGGPSIPQGSHKGNGNGWRLGLLCENVAGDDDAWYVSDDGGGGSSAAVSSGDAG